ncbi:hypothetical protein AB0O39_35995 [Streptomyces anulatus]|uniref:hypothetical protein n=1 Tax=Streptomyces anulatus TaxID=1892 RepID=UPI0034135316
MDDLLNSIALRRLSDHLSDLGSGLKYIGAIAGFTFNAIAYPFAGLYDMTLNEKGWGKKRYGHVHRYGGNHDLRHHRLQ